LLRRLSLVICILAACGGVDTQRASDRTSDSLESRFWEQYQFSAFEVEAYSSIEDMARAADAVVSAQIVSVGPGRVFQGDTPEDRVYYASLGLQVEEQLLGAQVKSPLEVELLLPQVFDDQGFQLAVTELAGWVPKGKILVFLREKNDPDPGVYRPVNSVGLFASTDRADIDTPLSFETPAESGVFQSSLGDIEDIHDLVAFVATFK